MPALRFADLLEDEDILIQAQSAARALVADDPELAHPGNARVKAHLEARYAGRLEMFGVG
jgi:RecG-like helicase